MDLSTLKRFCDYGWGFGQAILLHEQDDNKNNDNQTLVQILCHRSMESSIYRVPGPSPHVLLPGWGAYWPGEREGYWNQYATAIVTAEGPVCFWPVIPRMKKKEKDIRLWTEAFSSESEDTLEKPRRYGKVMLAGGYFTAFWHAMAVFNSWCKMRDVDDLYFIVEFEYDEEPDFFDKWVSALGIPRERIVVHDTTIFADEVLAAHYRDVDVDWSCLHALLHPQQTYPEEERHALIYFRSHSGVERDIPEDIHLDFAKALGERIPGLVVKTFYGSESMEETRDLFARAKVVIGPHGAGLSNLIFCAESIPVIEFLTLDMFRVWEAFGGQTFNLQWWPVLLDSFDSRGQIMDAIAVVEKALATNNWMT